LENTTSSGRRGDLTLSGFIVSALAGAVFVSGAYWLSLQESRAQGWIAHTYQVLAAIATARADVLDVQGGQRSLAASGSAGELELHEAARKSVVEDVSELGQLTADDPVQQRHVQQLQSLLAPGRESDLREVLQRMENQESQLLALRLEEHALAVKAFWAAMAVLLAALLAGLAALYWQVRRTRLAQHELFEREQQFHRMTDSVTEYAILQLDAEGNVLTWNPGAQRIKGYAPQDILGRHFSSFYTRQAVWERKPEQALAAAAQQGLFSEEDWRVRKDGSRFWASVAITPLRDGDGQVTGYCKITRDLSERKAAEEKLAAQVDERMRTEGQLQRLNARLESLVEERTRELQDTNAALIGAKDRLQALSARLISAQEEERRHIARELHDETGQALTLIRMQLGDLAVRASPPAVADCVQHVDRAINHIRGLALRLRPPMLDDLGLSDALEWVAEQQARAAGWQLHLDLPQLDERLPGEVETACFRICQEALTNAARYARATEVMVSLWVAGTRLELVVCDNGVGFELDRYRSREERTKHFGLVSMGERASLAGGAMEIDTAPGRGTRVHVLFALASEPGEQPASAPGELFA
jgi:PAS domain S-box-containing protein